MRFSGSWKHSCWSWEQVSLSWPGRSASSSTAMISTLICCSITANSSRLVVVELKLGAFKAEYKSQMELYLRWLAQNEREPDEDLPLGIILCSGKNSEQIELLELGSAGI